MDNENSKAAQNAFNHRKYAASKKTDEAVNNRYDKNNYDNVLHSTEKYHNTNTYQKSENITSNVKNNVSTAVENGQRFSSYTTYKAKQAASNTSNKATAYVVGGVAASAGKTGKSASKYAIKKVFSVPKSQSHIAEERYRRQITQRLKSKLNAPVDKARDALNASSVGIAVNAVGDKAVESVKTAIAPIKETADRVNAVGDNIKLAIDSKKAEARTAMKNLGKRVYKKSSTVRHIHRDYTIANARLQTILSSKQIVLAKRAAAKTFRIAQRKTVMVASYGREATSKVTGFVAERASKISAAEQRYAAANYTGDALAERYQATVYDTIQTSGGVAAKGGTKVAKEIAKQLTPTKMYKNYQDGVLAKHNANKSLRKVKKIAKDTRRNVKASFDAAKQAYVRTQQAKVYVKASMEAMKEIGVAAVRIGKEVIQISSAVVKMIADGIVTIIAAGGGIILLIVAAIIIILCLIAGMFSWIDTTPSDYNEYEDETNKELSVETYDIMISYLSTIKECTDWEQAYFYYVLGRYTDGNYSWEDVHLSPDEEWIKMENEWKEANKDKEPKYSDYVTNDIIFNGTDAELKEAIAKWAKALQDFYESMYEYLTEIFGVNWAELCREESIEQSDYHITPKNMDNPYYFAAYEGKNNMSDGEEYNGKPVRVNFISNLNINTDLTAVDILSLIAISDFLRKSYDDEYEENVYIDNGGKETTSMNISKDDICEFFYMTDFVQYATYLEEGMCSGMDCIRECEAVDNDGGSISPINLSGNVSIVNPEGDKDDDNNNNAADPEYNDPQYVFSRHGFKYYCNGTHKLLKGGVSSVQNVDLCLKAIVKAYDPAFTDVDEILNDETVPQEKKNEINNEIAEKAEELLPIYEMYKDYIIQILNDGANNDTPVFDNAEEPEADALFDYATSPLFATEAAKEYYEFLVMQENPPALGQESEEEKERWEKLKKASARWKFDVELEHDFGTVKSIYAGRENEEE